MPAWRILTTFWVAVEEPSRTGPEMEDDVSTYSLESDIQVRRRRIEDLNLAENNVFKYFSKTVFNCSLSLLQSVSTGAASFSFHQIFHSQFQKGPLYLPATACASKFVQKSANYDCGDKNVKLYINWCIIFGVDLCLIHFQNMKYTCNHCYKM